jgi:hypothetical protein
VLRRSLAVQVRRRRQHGLFCARLVVSIRQQTVQRWTGLQHEGHQKMTQLGSANRYTFGARIQQLNKMREIQYRIFRTMR